MQNFSIYDRDRRKHKVTQPLTDPKKAFSFRPDFSTNNSHPESCLPDSIRVSSSYLLVFLLRLLRVIIRASSSYLLAFLHLLDSTRVSSNMDQARLLRCLDRMVFRVAFLLFSINLSVSSLRIHTLLLSFP